MENILNDSFLFCKKCKGRLFTIINDNTICKTCGIFLYEGSQSIINEKKKNKIIHLNNVLKNIETINQNEIDDMLTDLKKSGSSPLIDSSYIAGLLKNKGKKGYIFYIQVHNKFLNNELYHTSKDKKIICLIFEGFIKYALEIYPDVLNNSIPYFQILHKIYTYIDINIDIKPSSSRNINESLDVIFESFLYSLCVKYLCNDEEVNPHTLMFKPSLISYPNLLYKKT